MFQDEWSKSYWIWDCPLLLRWSYQLRVWSAWAKIMSHSYLFFSLNFCSRVVFKCFLIKVMAVHCGWILNSILKLQNPEMWPLVPAFIVIIHQKARKLSVLSKNKIKRISYVVIAFFYMKAWMLREQRPLSRQQISLIWMAICIASCCLWAVLSQCRILMPAQYMNTQLFTFFFWTDNLHLFDCTVTWSLLTWTDTDWTCSGSRLMSQETQTQILT